MSRVISREFIDLLVDFEQFYKESKLGHYAGLCSAYRHFLKFKGISRNDIDLCFDLAYDLRELLKKFAPEPGPSSYNWEPFQKQPREEWLNKMVKKFNLQNEKT